MKQIGDPDTKYFNKFHPLFQEAGLSPVDFDPKYNKDWKKYKFGNYCNRGPKGKTQPYFYPVGWKGYALKVKGKYDNGNENWLTKDNNEEEWCVMFHGVRQQEIKPIMESGLQPDKKRNYYKEEICTLTGKKIGIGVYFSNHIEVCEKSHISQSIKIRDKEYILALQVRVSPEALRQCPKQSDLYKKIVEYKGNNSYYDKSLDDMNLWDNDYFVVNNTEHIRPYRILLKNVNRIERDRPVVMDRIFYSSEDEENESKRKSKPIQLVQKELVQPLHFFQNPQNLTKLDPVKSSAQKYQFDYECKDLFKKLEKENKLVNPLNLVINQNIEASNPEVLFYVLGDQMRQAGRVFSKSLQPDEKLLYSFHGQFAADSNGSQAYTLTLQETPSLTYEVIASDEKVRQEFLKNFRKSLSIDLKVPENQIQIVAIEEGSIRVVFEVLDAKGKSLGENQDFDALNSQFNQKYTPQLKLKSYFKEAALSVNDFDPNFNMTWDNQKFGDYDNRGPKDKPQPYFFPIGWKGYALKIGGRYDNGNENWLMMNGNKEEWYVMFHGTSSEGVQGIMRDGQKIESRPGGAQWYKNDLCLITKKKIDDGVYFSNHIEIGESYAMQRRQPTQIGEKKQFIVAFQSRVRPDALRQCPKDTMSYFTSYKAEEKAKNKNYNKTLDEEKYWKYSYFVVNDTKDIRPYRILLKELRN